MDLTRIPKIRSDLPHRANHSQDHRCCRVRRAQRAHHRATCSVLNGGHVACAPLPTYAIVISAWNPAGSPVRPSAACCHSVPPARRSWSRRRQAATALLPTVCEFGVFSSPCPKDAAGDVVQAVSCFRPSRARRGLGRGRTHSDYRCKNRCRDASHFRLRWLKNSLPGAERSAATMIPGSPDATLQSIRTGAVFALPD